MRRSRIGIATILMVTAAVHPAEATGQDLLPAAIGGAAGLAAGGYVSIGIWTAKARWKDDYMFAARDALGWEATPVLLGAATGAIVGFLDQDRLRHTVIGGTAGWFVGTGIGMTIGAEAWAPPEGRWAGGVIGGAAGLVLGSAVGLLWTPGDADAPADRGEARSPRIPLGVTIRF